jgi:hypothetical protein
MSKIPPIHWRRFATMFRLRDTTVFPQIAKLSPEKPDMLHKKKPSTMHTVLPERTAPSQMIPS